MLKILIDLQPMLPYFELPSPLTMVLVCSAFGIFIAFKFQNSFQGLDRFFLGSGSAGVLFVVSLAIVAFSNIQRSEENKKIRAENDLKIAVFVQSLSPQEIKQFNLDSLLFAIDHDQKRTKEELLILDALTHYNVDKIIWNSEDLLLFKSNKELNHLNIINKILIAHLEQK